MQFIQTSPNRFRATLVAICINIILFTGCAPTTQDMFADTLGVVPDTDKPESSEPVLAAINELSVKDPSARASLQREEVVPQEEKKKIILPAIDIQKAPDSIKTEGISPSSENLTTEENALVSTASYSPVRLNQLYFDNRNKYVGEDEQVDKAVGLTKASYTQINSSQLIHPLSFPSSTQAIDFENFIDSVNEKVNVQTYFFPIALIAFGAIVVAASIGYKLELRRIKAAGKVEQSKRNLWARKLG